MAASRNRCRLALIIRAINWKALLIGLCTTVLPLIPLSANQDSTLSFSLRGALLTETPVRELRDQIQSDEILVLDPYENEPIAFRALRLTEVLDAIYSESWREEEELLFSCRDGYQPTIPVDRVLSHDAWLAFDRVDQKNFTIEKLESGKIQEIDLLPSYVVWENLDNPRIRMEADYGWPYQLVGIDFVRREKYFRAMAPPNEAPPGVQQGFKQFRVHCSKCHKLNGQGGEIGPELNPTPGSGTPYPREWLKNWIENPNSVRPNTRMPALNPELPDRSLVVRSLIDYIQFMAALEPDGGN